MPAADVISELVRLAVGSGWRRLEASTEGPHDVDGYCVTPTGMQVRTSEARRAHRDPIGLLIDLLTRSGWRRLEVLNRAGIRGWCVQADGTGVSIREFLPETTRP
jgi:hypothetical protein